MRDSMGNKKEPVLEHKLFCGGYKTWQVLISTTQYIRYCADSQESNTEHLGLFKVSLKDAQMSGLWVGGIPN